MTEFNATRLVLDACFGPSPNGIFTRMIRAFCLSAMRRLSVGFSSGTETPRG